MKTKRISGKRRLRRKGIAFIAALIFITLFSALSVGIFSMSSNNVQMASNHHHANAALNAALSGLECARYIIRETETILRETLTLKTNRKDISPDEADEVWGKLRDHFEASHMEGGTEGSGDEIYSQHFILYSDTGAGFKIRFYRSDDDEKTVYIQCTGHQCNHRLRSQRETCNENCGGISRQVGLSVRMEKDKRVLSYGIASRGRIWLAGDTTVYGSIYSAWNLSTAQLTQLSALENQLKQRLTDGTLTSAAFNNLVSSLSLSASDRTAIRNDLLSGALSPRDAAARCIAKMAAPSMAPFNTTSDSTVLGSINTCWTKDQVASKNWQFETWDSDDNAVYQTDSDGNILYVTDADGNFLLDDNGDMIKARVINSKDEIQGICAGVNYGETPQNLAGMNIADYDTSEYKSTISSTVVSASGTVIQNGRLSTSGVATVTEYFPHAAGSYTTRSGSSLPLKRHVYENKTIRNVIVQPGTNALFKNCVFEDILYIDTNASGPTVGLPSSYNASTINTFLSTSKNYNNIRFENCEFRGVIVTNTPQALNSNWWMGNNLYFTGSANFNNQSAIKEATILAPHFNVNLGDANNGEVESDENVLTGAIVGGIVDIRGNAKIHGTVISMADTSGYTSGYVSNIGATLEDGGSETTTIEDIGTIEINPDEEQMLPSGITTPIVLKQLKNTYEEI